MADEANNYVASDDRDVDYKPLTDWKNEPKVSDLAADYTSAQSDHTHATGRIETWLDNLHVTGKAKFKSTKKGRSEITPKLIRKQAEWRYSALTEPFLSTPDLFNIYPVTFEDKAAAEQNELIINKQFNYDINKNKFIDTYVRTAVDEGTVIVRVGWEFEEEEVSEWELYIDETPENIMYHRKLAKMREKSPIEFKLLPVEVQYSHELAINNQFTKPVETKTIKITKNRPTVEVCEYDRVIIDPTCEGNIDKAGFIIYEFDTSMSELKKAGIYKNLKELKKEALPNPLSMSDTEVEKHGSSFTYKDKPRQKFSAREYWGYWDISGSGKVEPIVATYVGKTMIRMERNPFPDGKPPFVVAQYLPVRHEIYGEPDGSLLDDNQKIIGAVTRGMIDIMGRSANSQIGTRQDALDITNKRKFDNGEDFEYQGAAMNPDQLFYMHKYPEIPQSAGLMIQLQNNEAESLTGVKAYHDGIGGQSLGKTATGARGALDAASKRELGILRRLAAGVQEVATKIIGMNGVWLSEEEVVRVTNSEFVSIRRDGLEGEFDLRIAISTAEEDNAKAEELAFMLQTTGQTMGPAFSQVILADICKLRKMPDLAKAIAEFQPEPDPLLERERMADIMLKEAQAQEIMSRIGKNTSAAELNQANVEKTNSETDLNALEFVETEKGVTHERDLQKSSEQAKANAQLEFIKSALNKKSQQK